MAVYTELNDKFGYYQCSICGHVTQITKFVDVTYYDEEGNEYVVNEEVFDEDKSFEAVVKHEAEAHDIK